MDHITYLGSNSNPKYAREKCLNLEQWSESGKPKYHAILPFRWRGDIFRMRQRNKRKKMDKTKLPDKAKIQISKNQHKKT